MFDDGESAEDEMSDAVGCVIVAAVIVAATVFVSLDFLIWKIL